MDCTESLNLLSDLHDGALDDVMRTQVQSHLALCQPCLNVFSDLGEIVNLAVALNRDPEIAFPDEDAIWQRMKLTEHKIH
ncbi:MAG TPA: zf-HC2 domain-containing protein [Pyrinomonadaceae bacterium]|nr:zf-HC2 domain-containing protein [Pyrinomonadaceae bacterium]